MKDRCCLCGGSDTLKHCNLCGHTFCSLCRSNYFRRGLEAVKAILGRSQLFCGGEKHG